jgi:hypothetical protein
MVNVVAWANTCPINLVFKWGGIKVIELATQKYVCKIKISMGAFI